MTEVEFDAKTGWPDTSRPWNSHLYNNSLPIFQIDEYYGKDNWMVITNSGRTLTSHEVRIMAKEGHAAIVNNGNSILLFVHPELNETWNVYKLNDLRNHSNISTEGEPIAETD